MKTKFTDTASIAALLIRFGLDDGCFSSLTVKVEEQMLFLVTRMDTSNRLKLSAAIDGIQSGQKAALGMVYDLYGKVVYSVSLNILKHTADAEEATQDAFVILWKHAGSLSGKPEKVLPWLLRVVRNRSIDKIRKSNRRPPSAQVVETPEPAIQENNRAEKHTALDALMDSEQAERVKRAMEQLPADQKKVIELAYFSGFSQSEIAAELDEPLGTVKSRVRYALSRLRTELEGCHVI